MPGRELADVALAALLEQRIERQHVLVARTLGQGLDGRLGLFELRFQVCHVCFLAFLE